MAYNYCFGYLCNLDMVPCIFAVLEELTPNDGAIEIDGTNAFSVFDISYFLVKTNIYYSIIVALGG